MKSPIELQGDRLVIDPRRMTIGIACRAEYKGMTLFFIKTEEGVIEVYEVTKKEDVSK